MEMISLQGKTNFFEKRVGEYQKAGVMAGYGQGEALPDITHQCLMALLDSPLNKVGKLLIYIHTAKNVLVEVHPSLRVPRTFKRFAGLCVELLQRQKIRASGANETLMKVVQNPVEKYLPPGSRRFGLSVSGRQAVTMGISGCGVSDAQEECDLELWELRERLHRWNVEAEQGVADAAEGGHLLRDLNAFAWYWIFSKSSLSFSEEDKRDWETFGDFRRQYQQLHGQFPF
eukprot:g6143.t1